MAGQEKQAETGKRTRRALASAIRVEKVIAAGQRMGLNPSAIFLHPDGSIEVRYGEGKGTKIAPGTGWEDI